MKKVCFILLFLVIASSCSAKEDTESYNTTPIEDPNEKNDIIEKAQAAAEEIQSMRTITVITQQFTGDSINEETTVQVDNSLIVDPLSSSLHVSMATLGQETEFAMYSNKDATYYTENPNTENEDWQRLSDTDHEEITADYKSTTSFINYDILLEHIDELIVNDVDEDDTYDTAYYELILSGDSNIYHELLTQDNFVDTAEEQASVEAFSVSVKLEKDTGHLIDFATEMYGTVDFEGEVIDLFETMAFYFEGINIFEEEHFFVPTGVEQYIKNNE
ncbi:DUF6612 family protein [Oceanobacillus polygoni]|uniref:Uncharacterized protein n=1 Tax=Oceanobacillus polygoni TaxID=1235259 RepID=A0A9X0YUM2_9BACI|nr:DUF6612 family protein [Oceanobacillus polygoni]MBP2079163.1 hypothetical protein [Oceanobacillus polygoni]